MSYAGLESFRPTQEDEGEITMGSSDAFHELIGTMRSGFENEAAPAQKTKATSKFSLGDIQLNTDSSYEELIAEACRLSDLKKTTGLTDGEMEKEALYQMAESGLLDLSRQEIDLIFLKKTQPVPPPVRIVNSGITSKDVLVTMGGVLCLVVVAIIAIGFIALM